MTTTNNDLEDLITVAEIALKAEIVLLKSFIDLAVWQKNIILEKGIDKSVY